MRRSGNHAIINWLLRNSPNERSVFLNNCKPRVSPLSRFASIEVNLRRRNTEKALKNLPRVAAKAGEKAALVFSYEDCMPNEFGPGRPASGPFDERLIDADLILYRGFLNWSASLLRKMQRNPVMPALARATTMLRSMETYGRLLDLVIARDELELTCIEYDRWCTSEGYRAAVLETLDFASRDNGTGEVQPYGGGSSFQPEARTAGELASGSRMAQMADDPEYGLILGLCAQDDGFVEKLSQVFPEDAERLRAIARKVRG